MFANFVLFLRETDLRRYQKQVITFVSLFPEKAPYYQHLIEGKYDTLDRYSMAKD